MVLYVKVGLSMDSLSFRRDHSLELYPSSSNFHHFSIILGLNERRNLELLWMEVYVLRKGDVSNERS